MGENRASLQKGVLSHLEQLEAAAHEVALKRGELKAQEEDTARMKRRIKELRRQRDALRTKLDLCRSQLIGGKNTTNVDSGTTEAGQQALLEWKTETLKGLLQVFHLTGLSGKLTQRGACFCFSTAFENTYLDSYYLDLLIKQPVQILRHSVPPFIPLEQIAHKYLQTDIKRFLTVLSGHLNALAGRKFQVDQLQENYAAFLDGGLQGNSLCNLLEFSYRLARDSEAFPFVARLTYANLVSTLPTEATISCKEDAPAFLAELTAAHEALFREKPLHRVFSAITASTDSPSQSLSRESPLISSTSLSSEGHDGRHPPEAAAK
uniref:Centromere protein O n=1 Tax=Anolis carolinensis TaxID=28377 RepID=H9G3V5_ANOCA|nr:PREDICTED: centromere protein O [Anolis carolinensis]|eukprot:XP_008116770.1 PREDICTED: centromere protein O [Anolis carolinensis]